VHHRVADSGWLSSWSAWKRVIGSKPQDLRLALYRSAASSDHEDGCELAKASLAQPG